MAALSVRAKLEIACFNPESAIIAQAAGADRIEFCHEYATGGTTPQPSEFATLRPKISIPIFIMIRPRSGDFVYSDSEFEGMRTSIENFKSMADGFVFGILSGKTIDKSRNRELVELAHPKPCTFHRAFDAVENIQTALEDVISCGFKTILTSGGFSTASEGVENLARMIASTNSRIEIMPGGSVRSANIAQLKAIAPATFWHSSAIVGSNEITDEDEAKLLKSEL